MTDQYNHDAVIVGAGAAGMAAALTARHQGLDVIIVEKEPWFGGSTAVSGGAVWIPGNPHQRATGMTEEQDAALHYLRQETGGRADEAMLRAFLDCGPSMVEFMEAHTELRFSVREHSPDYHSDREGAALGGRVLDPLDIDGRELGDWIDRLHPPLPEFTIFGGMLVGRADITHFLRMTRSWSSFRYAVRRLAGHARDRLRHGRGMHLVMGNALAARLGKSVRDRAIPLWLDCPAEELLVENGRVAGVYVRRDGRRTLLRAARGVVLATGGGPQAPDLREHIAPHAQANGHWSMSPAANTGDGIRLGRALGGHLGEANSDNAFWTPVSLLPQPDGSTRPFPHLFLDRAKPGVIAVGADGRRFVNESASYHDFVRGMLGRGDTPSATFPVWLICDHHALRRYGLGAVRPFPAPYRQHLRSGYLQRGANAPALAVAIGVDAGALTATLKRFNEHATAGVDPDFGKGGSAYNRYLGDPDHRPNPCLRPLQGALYAIRLHPGDIGTSVGLVTDPRARVLDAEGAPIPGLYACGNDMNSIMAGSYPGAGITLGPALTFGFIAGNNLAGSSGPRTAGAN